MLLNLNYEKINKDDKGVILFLEQTSVWHGVVAWMEN